MEPLRESMVEGLPEDRAPSECKPEDIVETEP